jgi:hypothetical protein
LVPEHENFGLQRRPRPEEASESQPDQPAKIDHRREHQPIRARLPADFGFR